MAEYTLTLTAAEIDIALNRVTNPDQAPLFNSEELVTSGGVKNYVDTQVSSIPAVATLTTEVAELREDFYKENFTVAGTVSSTTTLVTFTAPEDGIYAGLVVGTYYYPVSSFNTHKLYWQNPNEVYIAGDEINGWIQVNPLNSSARLAFTREPVAMLQGQTINLRTRLVGTRTATYDLSFKLSRLL
jgi:hypothetical protein